MRVTIERGFVIAYGETAQDNHQLIQLTTPVATKTVNESIQRVYKKAGRPVGSKTKRRVCGICGRVCKGKKGIASHAKVHANEAKAVLSYNG